MRDLDINGKKDHGSTGSNNKCDTCGEGITAIVSRGPGVHRAAPCGHRISQQYIGKRRVVTDGGLDPCLNCGEDPERGHRCQKCGKLEPNGSPSNAAGREAMER